MSLLFPPIQPEEDMVAEVEDCEQHTRKRRMRQTRRQLDDMVRGAGSEWARRPGPPLLASYCTDEALQLAAHLS